MLFKKEEIKDLGEVNIENLEPVVETENIENMNNEELPEDSKKMVEIIMKLKKRETIYNKAVILLVMLNLFLTAIIIYLGIVKIV